MLHHCSKQWLLAPVCCVVANCQLAAWSLAKPCCVAVLVVVCLQVSLPTFHLGLPAYYVLALSEASSNLSRYDGVRYGLRATEGQAARDLKEMYAATRCAQCGSRLKADT